MSIMRVYVFCVHPYMFICLHMFLHLSVCLSVCRFVFLSVRPSVRPSIHPSIIYLSIYLVIQLSAWLLVCVVARLSVLCLYVCMSVCPNVIIITASSLEHWTSSNTCFLTHINNNTLTAFKPNSSLNMIMYYLNLKHLNLNANNTASINHYCLARTQSNKKKSHSNPFCHFPLFWSSVCLSFCPCFSSFVLSASFSLSLRVRFCICLSVPLSFFLINTDISVSSVNPLESVMRQRSPKGHLLRSASEKWPTLPFPPSIPRSAIWSQDSLSLDLSRRTGRHNRQTDTYRERGRHT